MKKFIFLCLLGMYGSCLLAQKDSAVFRLTSFVKNIQTFNRLYAQEKVYLHFDNTGYFIGETIWFKAYVTTATELSGTPMSRVLYVELISAEGEIIETHKLCIENGQAHGEFSLTHPKMRSGFYEIRAYTRMMLNWDQSALFSRVFPIFEPPVKDGAYADKTILTRSFVERIPITRERAEKSESLHMDFFPEGGTLVKGVSNTMAFKLTDESGRGIRAEGVLLQRNGDTVTTFSTRHLGMGSFIYIPTEKPHHVVLDYDGKKHSFNLPNAKDYGYVMHVDQSDPDQVEMQLHRSPVSSTPGLVGLTIQSRGRVYAFKVIDLQPEQTQYILQISRSELPTGVNQFTLFTPEGEVLAERMVFINQGEQLSIQAQKNKEKYAPFEPIQIGFEVKNENGKPVHTTFSLAIRDADTQIPTAYQENIQTNLLLSSDLKGFIEKPGYYFESNDAAHRENLDLLMLTQGYRRYEWKQMAGLEPFTVKHHIEKGIMINGKVLSLIRKKGNSNMDIHMTLFSDQGLFQKATCLSDSTGAFNYLTEDFYGKWNLQIESKRGKNRKEKWITLDRLFTPRGRSLNFFDTYIPPFDPNDAAKNTLTVKEEPLRLGEEDLKGIERRAKLLNEVTVKGDHNWEKIMLESASIAYDIPELEDKLEDAAKLYNEEYKELLYRINPYYNYGTYKGRPIQYIFQGLRSGELPVDLFGLNTVIDRGFQGKKEGYVNRDRVVHTGSNAPGAIGPLRSSEITSIAIIERTEKLAAHLPNWVFQGFSRTPVIIFVKIDRRRAKNREPVGVRLTSIQGFSKPRSFYNPSYKEFTLPNEEDYRRTLYWNPNVTTDKDGKASVSFFNNGTCQHMEISAETVTSDGITGFYQAN